MSLLLGKKIWSAHDNRYSAVVTCQGHMRVNLL